MKTIYFPAIFHPEEVGYSASVPDLEGCFTQGDTMEETLTMLEDAIGLMLEDCESIPRPSDPAGLIPEQGDFVVAVPFSLLNYRRRNDTRSVKKTLSLPAWLNAAAEEAHINFSGVLQDALKAKLNIL